MSNKKVEELLAKAAEADAIAEKFAPSFCKTNWLAIAEGYRKLARENEGPTKATSDQPLP